MNAHQRRIRRRWAERAAARFQAAFLQEVERYARLSEVPLLAPEAGGSSFVVPVRPRRTLI